MIHTEDELAGLTEAWQAAGLNRRAAKEAARLTDVRMTAARILNDPADSLICGFQWAHTPQGSEFWARIHTKLSTE